MMPATGWPTMFPASSDPKYRKWSDALSMARLKVGLLVAGVAILTFIALNLSRYPDIDHTWLNINLTQLAILLICTGLIFSSLAPKAIAPTYLLLSLSLTLAPLLWHLAIDSIIKFDVFTWTLVFLGQATLLPLRWHLYLSSQVLLLLALIVIHVAYSGELRLVAPHDDWDFLLLYFLWFSVISTTAVFLHEKLQYVEFTGRHFLQIERQRSEKLLRNILPDVIANRLRDGESTIADHCPETSVLFADIVGFSELASQLSPQQLVGLLNELFRDFDQLLDDHHIEKIKTIGDAYMAVSGVPTANPNHLSNMADFALAMQQTLERFNEEHPYPLQIRIGIHTGPVVAGVIGERKFSYDLWGDTVNTASRLESNGIPGEIQVSWEVYEALSEHYRFVEREPIELKGIGTMKTWLLKGGL